VNSLTSSVTHIDTKHAAQLPSAGDIELIEADAWAKLQLNVPREFQARLGISVQRHAGAVILLASKSATLPINRVIGLGLVAPLQERELDEVIAIYSMAGVERFIVQWSPVAEPATAPDWFLSRGFTLLARRIAKVYRRAHVVSAALANPLLTVAEIGLEGAATFERVVAKALGVPEGLEVGIRSTMGLPGWRYYLVFDGDRPIAGAALYVRGRLAWFGLGATIETDRRRGAQAALLAHRLRDAVADGCDWVSADTLAETSDHPSQSYRNMRRAGFAMLYERPNYLLDLRNVKAR
jgi:hypothetical protein